MSEELDPAEFVQRIRQLGEQRDQQDAERVRKLEEEIIQGRSERLARRAERARSLSPEKPTTPQQQALRSAANTPRTEQEPEPQTQGQTQGQTQEKATGTPAPVMEPPSQQAARDDSLQRLTGSPAQALDDLEPKKPAVSAAALGRSGTLSWNRRPQSGTGSIRRPLSTMSASSDKNAVSPTRDLPEPPSPEKPTPSRSQIAQSLGSKDPDWFKQTADRGIGSAAYRRSQDDNSSDAGSTSARRQLPGLSRDSAAEPKLSSPPLDSPRSISPSRASSFRGSAALSNRFSTNTSLSGGDDEPAAKRGSPLPILESQRFAPPSEQGSSGDGGDPRALAMSPTQGRISPERPASPTKGMGGFVQSAMLKRSDSVNKRWSTQTPPSGLNRQNSTLSNRGSIMGAPSGLPNTDPRPSSLSRGNSIEPSSRPGSSSSNLAFTKDLADRDATPKGEFVRPPLPHHRSDIADIVSKTEFVRPALPHNRSKSVASLYTEDNQDETSPPSPSKRWSPTKSSWLESALNKPDSPKPKLPPPQQPSWMAEISRKKQERGSADLSKGSPLQSAPADGPGSGRSSPIKELHSGRSSPVKDLQLRPLSLRKTELPIQEEEAETAGPFPRSTPVLASKRSFAAKSETQPQEDLKEKAESPKKSIETPKEVAEPVQSMSKTKPVTSPKPTAIKPDAKTTEEPRKLPETPKETIEAPSDAPEPAPVKPLFSAAQLSKESYTSSSPAIKPKPRTPPKKDFRAGLRPRQNTAEPKKNEVSELQNVFGRLKKAETKNYVAPDPLKDNILRGKSGLVHTGGPKPSARRDELKESLITTKEAILTKAQETGSAALKKPEVPPQPSTTPEAIAKRKHLGKSDSISKPPPLKEPESPTPEALSRKKSLRAIKPLAAEKQAPSASSLPAKEFGKNSKLADRFNPALAGLLARGPPAASPKSAPAGEDSTSLPLRPVQAEDPGPAPELTHVTKGRARGPKRRAPAAAKQAVAEKTETAPTKVAPIAAVPSKNAEDVLPSTKVPKTDGAPEQPPVTRTPARESFKAKPMTPPKSPNLSQKAENAPSSESRKHERSLSPEISRKPEKLSSPQMSRKLEKPSTPEVARKFELEKPASPEVSRKDEKPLSPGIARKPEISPKVEKPTSPEVPRRKPSFELGRKVSAEVKQPLKQSDGPEQPKAAAAATIVAWRKSRPLPTPPIKPTSQTDTTTALKEIPPPNGEATPIKATPVKEADSPASRFSVKSVTSLWGRQSASSSPVATPTKAPIKLPTKADEQAAMENAGLVRPDPAEVQTKPQPQAPKPKPVGLGLGSLGGWSGFGGARSRESSPAQSPPPRALPVSPPASGDRPQSEPFKAPARLKPEGLLAEFFDEPPMTTGELPQHIDTTHILQNPPLDLGPSSKIRFLRKQMQEITGDGKLIPVPAQEEHVLFQDSMYICTHVFGDSKGVRATEVYLWCGNGVPESTLEDAQLFARNIAKQNQGKLFVLRQGKEIPNFFEALGGIVITRRGSRPGAKQYMLCGRRHLGHIAFDEVDFSLKGLCSGFAYIISTSSGKVFIWKGRGCSAEELSGARLVGMDLNLSGDLVEVDEGAEPAELFTFFSSTTPASSKAPSIPRSAEHWRYKATSEKYRSRLFRIEQQSGASGWGQGLQVSSFFAPLLRRPSWQSTERPQTPRTPKTPPATAGTTKVVEIMPFVQGDLEPEYIYVLDAFFEMYIIVGALSRSQSQAFSTALMFAQDYSILAVSEEDRPFVPVTTVVLEGVPRDMKSVFRFWDDARIPTEGLMTGKLGRGKSLRIMGLEKALEATRTAPGA